MSEVLCHEWSMILKHISSDMFLFLPNATPSNSKGHKGWCESSTTKMKQIDNSAAPWNKFLTTCVQPECHVNVEQPGIQGSSCVQDPTHNLARSNLQINQPAGLGDHKPWAQGT